MKQIIESANAPAAIGPYSQAVRAGNLLFISGQIPIVPATGVFPEGGVKEQTRQVLENVGAILAEAGRSFADVVKATVYLKDMAYFADMNAVYSEYFMRECPARAAFAVAGLPRDALVEIETIVYME